MDASRRRFHPLWFAIAGLLGIAATTAVPMAANSSDSALPAVATGIATIAAVEAPAAVPAPPAATAPVAPAALATPTVAERCQQARATVAGPIRAMLMAMNPLSGQGPQS